MRGKAEIAKIKELDRIASEKILTICDELRLDLQHLGWEDIMVGDYDEAHVVLARMGDEQLVRDKYDNGEAVDGCDYIYTNALQI